MTNGQNKNETLFIDDEGAINEWLNIQQSVSNMEKFA